MVAGVLWGAVGGVIMTSLGLGDPGFKSMKGRRIFLPNYFEGVYITRYGSRRDVGGIMTSLGLGDPGFKSMKERRIFLSETSEPALIPTEWFPSRQ